MYSLTNISLKYSYKVLCMNSSMKMRMREPLEIFFRVTVPVEKSIQSGDLSLPHLLFRIFTTVGFSHINISQLTQEFSRTSGKGCVGGNLTPPSGESAH